MRRAQWAWFFHNSALAEPPGGTASRQGLPRQTALLLTNQSQIPKIHHRPGGTNIVGFASAIFPG